MRKCLLARFVMVWLRKVITNAHTVVQCLKMKMMIPMLLNPVLQVQAVEVQVNRAVHQVQAVEVQVNRAALL